MHCAAPYCTGLKAEWGAEWIKTIKTTTDFPVDTRTVVKVTCSYSDAVLEGDSELTCITGTVYTFSEEPRCTIPGEINCKFHILGTKNHDCIIGKPHCHINTLILIS